MTPIDDFLNIALPRLYFDVLLNFVDVTDGQTVENVHEDKHEDKDKGDEKKIVEEAFKFYVRVVQFTNKHNESSKESCSYKVKTVGSFVWSFTGKKRKKCIAW